MKSRLARAVILLAFLPRVAMAQSAHWPSVHQTNGWYGFIYERQLNPKLAFTSDVQWRRNGLVEHPKQMFMVGGLAWRAAPGMRLTLGGGYIAHSPYGLLPAPLPVHEYQLWYQLQFNQHAGAFEFAHRYRFENRWLHEVPRDDNNETTDAQTTVAHRLRYQLRAAHPLGSLTRNKRPLLAIAGDEAFLAFAPTDRGVSFDQNRASAGIAFPVRRSDRLEVQYMQQWIAITRVHTAEVNRTLLVMFVHSLLY